MTALDPRSVAQRRMRRQHLWGPPLADLDSVFEYMGAIQAQEFPVAKWSIGQRLKGRTNSALQSAFDEGKFLRTHTLRPTWHFVSPKDIRWMQELTGPRVMAQSRARLAQLDLSARDLTRAARFFMKVLQGGNHLTRKELTEALDREGLDPTGQRFPYLVSAAELDAVVCSGAMKGKQQTYALVEERAPEAPSMDPDAALAELTRRYFHSRGPATIKDFSWWSTLKMADIRRGLEMVGDELKSEVFEGRTYYFADRATRATSGAFDLIQPYEEIAISYTESRDALLGRYGRNWSGTERPQYMNTILFDGQTIGHWKPVVSEEAVTIHTFFYRRLSAAEKQGMDRAVARYGRFMERPATWVQGRSRRG